MTKTIALLNQKGGAGKTTLSTNIAYGLQQKGYRVLLVDSDPQGSARDWSEENKGDLIPVVGLDRETLPKDLKAISSGYDWVVIDGAPQIAKLSAAAIKAADLILIPVQPSPYDIWATSDLVDLIQARQEVTDGLPVAHFVISRSIQNTTIAKEAYEVLKGYNFPILKTATVSRVTYSNTAGKGETVYHSKDQKAIDEIEGIIGEVEAILNEA